MDYFGRYFFLFDIFTINVSILLGQWITLEGNVVVASHGVMVLFQSFWVNGLLWKRHTALVVHDFLVRFNPSGSMDYFGRVPTFERPFLKSTFQSFWVNGLLWK